MADGIPAPLAGWESFYVIVGSSSAALTGLQFVVIVLGTEIEVLADAQAIGAFGTPTVVHFSLALLVSAVLSAPWPALPGAALAVALCGAGGLLYAVGVTRRALRQTAYTPVFEDWIWHSGLPLVTYAALLVAAIALPRRPAPSLFAVGAATLLLLFIGIHNAWDAVVYMAGRRRRGDQADQAK